MTVNTEILPHAIRLAELMLSCETTKDRGTTLAHDLADQLLPEKAVVTETAAKPAVKPAPAPAPAPKPEATPVTKLQMTAKANGVTLEQYLATEGWTEELLIEQGLAERVSAAPAPAPKPAAKPAPAPAPKPEATAGTATLTPEELNNALVAEFRRLGSREGIDNAMAEFGVTSVNDLKPEQYQPLLEKVKAL